MAVAALSGAARASASGKADVILNQTQVTDPTGDSNGGPDLSSLAVTTYADGTVSFVVQLANRAFLQKGETVQIFLDLNADRVTDLNLSIWSSFDPSYLARWNGTSYQNIRQLPELMQTSGSISVRLSLGELQSDGAVPIGSDINVAVASYTEDSSGNVPSNSPDDYLPTLNTWVDHSIQKPTTTTTTTKTPATVVSPPAAAAGSSKPTTKVTGKVKIEHLAPFSAKRGHDVTFHVTLAGPSKLLGTFKVCVQLPVGIGTHSQMCRSNTETGAHGAVPLTFTVFVSPTARIGTTHIGVVGSAPGSSATTTEVVHIVKA
ncbi:MAG TPA: hypothetical protein VG652_09825 [Gaiellaceae bacterium]|nr:hypothetical protein [Gaiellaceae bacterium]